MTVTMRRPNYSDDKTYVHANGQQRLEIDYIPAPFNDEVEVNKAKLIQLEHAHGIEFNKQLALA